MNWEGKGIRVDGEYLNNLRFADDILGSSEKPQELQTMLTDLNTENKKVGLKMNKTKTNVMFNSTAQKVPIEVDGEQLEEVDEYIYLGQLIKLSKNHDSEIKRRIKIVWKHLG